MAEPLEDKIELKRLDAELRRRPGPLIPLPDHDEDEYGVVPRMSGRMPGGHSQGGTSSSTSFQLDTTSGMDEALRRADALAEAVAQRDAAMYGRGGELDMAEAMSSADRIRSLRDYLRQVNGGVTDSAPYQFAIPMVRLGGVSGSSSSQSGGTRTGAH
jgi:hypothetical protein